MKIRKPLIVPMFALAFAGVLLAGGCQADQKAAEAPKTVAPAKAMAMNTSCPFSGEACNGDIASDYKAGKVAFCCAGCKAKWAKLTDAEKDAKLASMAKVK